MEKRALLFFLCMTMPLGAYTELNQTSSHLNGPNCWNGALYAARVLRYKRYIDPAEWLIHLERNCLEIAHAELGDVGRLYHVDAITTEVHAYVHLDEETIFAKHGLAVAHGYEIMSYDKMLFSYGRTRSCRMKNLTDPACYHHKKYYRCFKAADFPQEIIQINAALEGLAFDDATRYERGYHCDGAIHQARLDYLLKIKEALLSYQQLETGLKLDQELSKALLESYTTQLYELQVSTRVMKCSSRAKKYKELKEVTSLLKRVLTST